MRTSILLSIVLISSSIYAGEHRHWVFFDLGKTLLAHGEFDEENNTYFDQRYYPDTHAYLISLKAAGFRIGIVTDIPEAWGATIEDRVDALKAFIARGWVDQNHDAFGWDMIDALIVPRSDEDLKSSGSTAMFEAAMGRAYPCSVFFQGENPAEIAMAEGLGMESYLVESSGSFYKPIEELKTSLGTSLGCLP